MTTTSPESAQLPAPYFSPREQRVKHAGAIFRWGAIANAVLAGLLLLAALVAAAGWVDDFFTTLAGATLANFDGEADTAVLGATLLILANVSGLLVAMIGVIAQELWSILAVIGIIALNVAALVVLGFYPALAAIVPAAIGGLRIISDFRAFRLNPVMLKEVRERMRGARAFVVITVYLGLMSGFAVLLYLLQRGVFEENATAVTGELGRIIFAGVVGLELLLIIFIAPAFTAGAVSNERERKTYDLLQITMLPKPSFLVGKLESALSYIFLLLLAAIPLQSIAFFFGGVSESELILAFIILTVTTITLGTVGIYFSTTVDRTLTASVRAYTAAFVITVGIPIALGFFVNIYNNAISGTGTNATNTPAVEALLIYLGHIVVSLNPVLTSLSTQQLLVEQQQTVFWTATLRSDGSVIPMISPWITFTITYLIVSAVLLMLAVRRMRRADE